jgi:hypothetical protein
MSRFLFGLVCFVALLPAGALEKVAKMPSESVVAQLNGKPFTAGELQRLLQVVDEQARKAFDTDPTAFLQYHAWLLRLQTEAEKKKLAEQQPYRDQLAFERLKILARAGLDNALATAESTPEEVQALYDAGRDRFREAKVRMIYIPFASQELAGSGAAGNTPTEAAARAKAEDLARRAKSGEDFVKLAQEANPGQLRAAPPLTVRPDSKNPPEHMRAVILKSSPGEVTPALRHDNGFYIFKIDSFSVLPLHEVSGQLHQEIRQRRYHEWRERTRTESTAVIEEKSLLVTDNAK